MFGDLRCRKGIIPPGHFACGSWFFGLWILDAIAAPIKALPLLACFILLHHKRNERIQATVSACWPLWRPGGIPAEQRLEDYDNILGLRPSDVSNSTPPSWTDARTSQQ